MPLYINAGQAADFFAKLRLELPKDSKDFFTRDEMLLNVEQLLRTEYPKTMFVWDALQMERQALSKMLLLPSKSEHEGQLQGGESWLTRVY